MMLVSLCSCPLWHFRAREGKVLILNIFVIHHLIHRARQRNLGFAVACATDIISDFAISTSRDGYIRLYLASGL